MSNIIGSVGVAVTPDADNFWREFEARTRPGAVRAGEQSGNAWQTGFRTATRDTTVHVRADTAQAQQGLNRMSRDFDRQRSGFETVIRTAITLAPAIVPIGAAAAAAAAEFGALGAAGLLAVKGIKDQMHYGTQTGVAYKQGIRDLNVELNKLGGVASRGLLRGFQDSVAKLKADLPSLNQTIAQQSIHLGDAVSHLTGGLVGGFATFAPLLDRVGYSIDAIAAKFEEWATGPGGAKFSGALTTSYNKLAPIVDDLAKGVAHLVAASNGVGLGILSDLGLLARAVSAFPTPALQAIIAGFVAFRTAGAVSGVIQSLVASISNAYAPIAARSAAAAAAQNAANAQMAASAAATAAEVAAAQAVEAEAVAASQAQIAAALAGTGSVLEASAAEAAAYSAAQAASFRAAATAATASAEQQAAAAAEAAAAARTATAGAAGGFTAALGPIGLVAGALGILGLTFLATGNDTQQATQELQDYTSALRSAKGAINDNVRAKIADTLASNGAFDAAKKLGVTQSDLIDAVTGQAGAYSRVKAAIAAVNPDSKALGDGLYKITGYSGSASSAAAKLNDIIGSQRGVFAAAARAANDELYAMLGLGDASAAAARAFQNGNSAVAAYGEALQKFNESADKAADRAALIGATLVAANGDFLSYSKTMVTAATANQQMVRDFADLKSGVIDLKTGTIDYHNAAAGPLLNDLQNLQTAAMNAASATYQHELATKGGTKAAEDAFDVYRNDTRGALVDAAKHLGLTKDQAKKLADQYFNIKNAGDLKKKIALLGGDQVKTILKGILDDLDIIAGKKTVAHVDVIYDYHGPPNLSGVGTKSYNVDPKYKGPGRADGGIINVGTGPRADDVLIRASKGEFVVNAAQTAKHRGLLESINSGARGFETGGFVDVDYRSSATVDAQKAADRRAKQAKEHPKKVPIDYYVRGIDYTSFRAASNAALSDFRAQVTLGVKVQGKDLDNFRKAVKGTADQAASAFTGLFADLTRLGLRGNSGGAAVLRGLNSRIGGEINRRNTLTGQIADRQTARADLVSSVKSGFAGAFDIASSGTGYNGSQPVTFANIYANAKQQDNRARAAKAGLDQLRRLGLNKTELVQLSQAGVDALPQIQALAHASGSQIAALNSRYADINRQGAAAGAAVGDAVYAGGIAALTKQRADVNKKIQSDTAKLAAEVVSLRRDLAARPVIIQVDGREIARATASGVSRNKRRT